MNCAPPAAVSSCFNCQPNCAAASMYGDATPTPCRSCAKSSAALTLTASSTPAALQEISDRHVAYHRPTGRAPVEFRRAPSAREAAHRRLCPLRLLPPRLPHLRTLGRRDGLATRPHLHDQESRTGRSPARQPLSHPH